MVRTFDDYKQKVQGQKRGKKSGALMFGYLFHREISLYISYFIVRFLPRVQPNHISLFMILLGSVGSALLFVDSELYRMFGIIVVYGAFLLDKVDGEVARFKNEESLAGLYLDEFFHALVPFLFTFGLFFNEAFAAGKVYVALLAVLIFLTVFRRYERKWCMIAVVKKFGSIEKHFSNSKVKSRSFHFLLNNHLVRFASIVERFDILLLVAFLGQVIQIIYSVEIIKWLLVVYTVLSVMYSARWFGLNFLGEFNKRVHEFNTLVRKVKDN